MSGAYVSEMAHFLYDSTTTKTAVIPVTAACSTSSFLVLAVMCPGSTANTLWTATDTKGNTWTTRQFQAAATSSNGQVALLTCAPSVALTTSDTVSVTVDNTGATRWAALGMNYSGMSGYDTGTTNAGATSTSLNSGTTSAGSQNDQLLVAAFARTGAAETTTPSGASASFTLQGTLDTTTTVRALDVIWGFVSSAGTRNITATMGGSHPWTGAIVVANVTATPAMTFVKTVTVG